RLERLDGHNIPGRESFYASCAALVMLHAGCLQPIKRVFVSQTTSQGKITGNGASRRVNAEERGFRSSGLQRDQWRDVIDALLASQNDGQFGDGRIVQK